MTKICKPELKVASGILDGNWTGSTLQTCIAQAQAVNPDFRVHTRAPTFGVCNMAL